MTTFNATISMTVTEIEAYKDCVGHCNLADHVFDGIKYPARTLVIERVRQKGDVVDGNVEAEVTYTRTDPTKNGRVPGIMFPDVPRNIALTPGDPTANVNSLEKSLEVSLGPSTTATIDISGDASIEILRFVIEHDGTSTLKVTRAGAGAVNLLLHNGVSRTVYEIVQGPSGALLPSLIFEGGTVVKNATSAAVDVGSGVAMSDVGNITTPNDASFASYDSAGDENELIDSNAVVMAVSVDSLSPDPSNPNFTIGIIQSEYQSEGVFEWWSASESGPSLTPAQVNDPTFTLRVTIDVDGEELVLDLGGFGFGVPSTALIDNVKIEFRWSWSGTTGRISQARASLVVH